MAKEMLIVRYSSSTKKLRMRRKRQKAQATYSIIVVIATVYPLHYTLYIKHYIQYS